MSEKVAIITGAGKGIGEETAIKLGKEGVWVCCNSLGDSGAKTAEKINQTGGRAIFVRGDVSQKKDVSRIVAETVNVFKGIDILVNNAGIVLPGTVENTIENDWDRTMAVNVKGIYLMSQAALPYIIERKGTIVNNASSAALKGVKDRFVYTASKGAVLSLTRSMAADLIAYGVRVNCICPGTTSTPSLENRLAQFDDYEKTKQAFISRQPLGRFGEPGEIADGILYLIHAAFCTGTVLSVDGGMTM
jgi:NAD(P)-dependent dehydrogenase (short-subunit alcohol dehydrogenase family)